MRYTLEGDLPFLSPLVFMGETVRGKGTCASLSCFEDVCPGCLLSGAVTNEVFCHQGPSPAFPSPKCPMLQACKPPDRAVLLWGGCMSGLHHGHTG